VEASRRAILASRQVPPVVLEYISDSCRLLRVRKILGDLFDEVSLVVR